jgi:MoaA/NifB/PqqE/SkfB family radical SAM enzyme
LPDTAKLCHDSSCNLSCPSCRKEMIVADGRAQAELDRVVGDFILPLVSGATLLILSGDGDPFASRHYRAILRSTKESNPDLRIALHTNAVLCDREAWKTCRLEGRVDWADVSVDAARAETYAVVRRGGDFARLGANLEFLGGLRRQGEIKNLRISFVVQALNFREMPAFVAWGKRIGADRVRFSLIREWSRGLNADDFRRAKIWDEAHPRHDAFLDVLRHPLLRDPVVVLGDVVPFFDRANRPRPPLERLRRWLRSRAA